MTKKIEKQDFINKLYFDIPIVKKLIFRYYHRI